MSSIIFQLSGFYRTNIYIKEIKYLCRILLQRCLLVCGITLKIQQTERLKNMNNKKIIASVTAILILPTIGVSANVNYTVQKGDSYWNISQKFDTNLKAILEANNATENSSLYIGETIKVPSYTYIAQKGDSYYMIAKKCGVSLSSLLEANNATNNSNIYVGQKITIPETKPYKTHIVKKGETFWIIANKYNIELKELLSINNASESTILYVGDILKIPSGSINETTPPANPSDSPNITYITHIVKNGDTLWNLAINYGIPYSELLEVNSLSESGYIYTGLSLKIPVHHIPIKEAPEGYGELLEWFSEAQYVIPINSVIQIVDLETGKSFNAKRTIGSGHADCEPLTANDTAIMKDIWGGNLNWNKRSVLVKINGRTIAASAAGMLHAGNDGAEGGVWTGWRSDNYGEGINYDYIKGNDAHGHFDLHFYKSIGHSSGTENKTHQNNVLKSAGKS